MLVDYEVGCELVKNDATNWGFGPRVARRPTVMVRFNPNEYDKRHVSLEERCDALVLKRLFIGFIIRSTKYVLPLKADKHIEAALNTEGNMLVLEVVYKSTYFFYL